MLNLEGKIALITGAGRERGIGWASALALARHGVSVVVTDIARPRLDAQWKGQTVIAEDTSGLERLAADIEGLGVRCLPMRLDVTNSAEVETCVSEATRAFGGIDVLFNNAGTPIGISPFLETTDAVWDFSWRTNVMGMVYTCQAAIPIMQERGGGSIINNSSIAGLRATANSAAYTTTKFAVVGLTRSLALDFGSSKIRSNAVCPGTIETQMTEDAFRVRTGSTRKPEGHSKPSRGGRPDPALGRRGTPEDVANVVAWLASDASGYVNGVEIRIDGGWEIGL